MPGEPMLPELICPECFKRVEDYAGGIEKHLEPDAEEYCEICARKIIDKYFSISRIELSDEITREIIPKILACESDGCGRKWDSESNDYFLDETNSNLLELFVDVVSGKVENPYQKILNLINDQGYIDEIELSDIRCSACGCDIDGWYADIKTEVIYRTLPEIPNLPEEIKILPLKTSAHRIEYYRSDCSPYLIHLTHTNSVVVGYSNIDYEDNREQLQAPQILWLILASQTLRKFKGPGLREASVCFSEKPLIGLKETLLGQENKEREKKKAIKWAPYGVMFEKDYLIKLGVSPVLPLDFRDMQLLPQEMKWRRVPFSNSDNFLHEREWRSKDDIKFDSQECIVLVPDFSQAESFKKALEMKQIKVKGILPILEVFASI